MELNIENRLTLKWGALKSWKFCSEKANELIEEYEKADDITDRCTPKQKEIICELIDICDDATIYIHYYGKFVSKDEAKEYVLNYYK